MCGAGGEVKDVRLQWCMGIMCWCSPAQRGMRLLIILATPRIMAIVMRWRQYVLKADCSPLVPPVAETALKINIGYLTANRTAPATLLPTSNLLRWRLLLCSLRHLRQSTNQA